MRLQTPTVQIGQVSIGGKSPVAIQSMTNTDTADAHATAQQCIELADAGSEIVRITVNSPAAAAAVPEIRRLLDQQGYEQLPLVGDFHFNGHELLTDFPETAKILTKYRINPGNVNYGESTDENFETMIKIAISHDKPVRIGVNWGSLDQKLLTELMEKNAALPEPKDDKEVVVEAMVESALRSAARAQTLGLPASHIVLSVKMSQVPDMIAAYQLLADHMQSTKKLYAIHLGLTEAGSGIKGTISSAAALATLLNQGIGDTIRISLTPTPDEPRTKEVEACKTLLQSLGLRHFQPQVTSCPGCGRTDSKFFQELAAEVNSHIQAKLAAWREQYPGVEELNIAVMGCVVNGPGESRHADIAISLPGTGEEKMAPVFIDGKFHKTLTGTDLSTQFIKILEDYVVKRFS